MTDNAAVASLLAALTQRAQQQQPQGVPPQQAYSQFDPRSSSQLFSVPQGQISNPLAQYGLQQPPGAQNATSAALAAVAGAYNLPQPTNSGYLDIATILKPDSNSLTIGEYYGRTTSADRSHDDRDRYHDEDRSRGHDRSDRDRGRSDDRRRRRSPTPPRLREDERCRECSPKRDFSPGGTRTESLLVKTPFIGLVIGRGGESLKRLENDSGARVQFITNGKEGPERVCNISGTAEQIRAAKSTIMYMIENAVLDSRGRPLQGGAGR